ncbi:hypothetical protein CCACVL1_07881 [Corchorus capsularis]|uniref:Uncharacterized protein n=1 Tax=Corchorus capsularis TaxID=210143 RepID=A0A1R3J3G6_COCAP|nr:hypothetical protein CCACVL1_07881 [Corchorus capsularis]
MVPLQPSCRLHHLNYSFMKHVRRKYCNGASFTGDDEMGFGVNLILQTYNKACWILQILSFLYMGRLLEGSGMGIITYTVTLSRIVAVLIPSFSNKTWTLYWPLLFASSVHLDGSGGEDVDKLAVNELFEVALNESKNSPLILFVKDIEKSVGGNTNYHPGGLSSTKFGANQMALPDLAFPNNEIDIDMDIDLLEEPITITHGSASRAECQQVSEPRVNGTQILLEESLNVVNRLRQLRAPVRDLMATLDPDNTAQSLNDD